MGGNENTMLKYLMNFTFNHLASFFIFVLLVFAFAFSAAFARNVLL